MMVICGAGENLHLADFAGSGAFGALADLEFDCLALFEKSEAICRDVFVVHKNILAVSSDKQRRRSWRQYQDPRRKWRRRESNPRPETFLQRLLRA